MTDMLTPRRLRRLIYASAFSGRAKALSEALGDILAKSIQNNRLVGVTGKLIVGDGRFLQLLEGPAVSVGEVYERIAGDPRHTELTILCDTTAEQRLYRDWSMAHHQIGPADRGVLRDLGVDVFAPDRLDAQKALELFTRLNARP